MRFHYLRKTLPVIPSIFQMLDRGFFVRYGPVGQIFISAKAASILSA